MTNLTMMNFLLLILATATTAFQPSASATRHSSSYLPLSSTTTAAGREKEEAAKKSHLYVPSERDAYYEGNVARYLLDLDDEGATFDFCGGKLFFFV